jgi:biopolymer transport protein ExbD
MHIPTHARRGSIGINMTPMIDVVFQLLIFFLVSSHLAKQEAQLPLPLPLAESGQRESPDASRRVAVNLLVDGRIVVAGKSTPAADLTHRLAKKRDETGGDLEVRIRSDRNVAYQYVEPVLLACARAGVWNVNFAVYRAEEAH